MTIPPRFLDEIRARVSVSDIVGRSVKLIRAGREFKACCPFHNEKSPSFTVNDDKQFYHCFGCGAHGDVISFLQQHNNLSFIEAVEMLSAQAGLQMPQSTPEEVEKAKKAKDLYDLMDQAAAFFQQQLFAAENGDILDYVRSRGLVESDLQNFKVGYAPADRQALRKVLSAKGFSDQEMIEAGVLKESNRGGEPYAFFNDRVMFPVSDRRGRVIAFGGRALPESVRPPSGQSDFKPPKYINSSDTPLFDKSRTLYGAALARQASGDGKPILVTEGYMDVIACHRAGFTGAVAPMGTALTEEQAVMLWKMIAAHEKVPILCFDGDNAGRKAAARACERILPLLKPNQSARFAFLPDGQDPDSLIRSSGAAAFQAVLDASLSLLDFLWLIHTQSRDLSTPEARAGVSKDLKDAVAVIADVEVQKHYNSLIRDKISEVFFPRREYGRNFSQGGASGRGGGLLRGRIKPRAPVFKDIAQRILLAAALNHPGIYDDIEEEFAQLEFAHGDLDRLRQSVAELLSGGGGLESEDLRAYLMERGFEKEIGDILSQSVYVHAAFAAPHADSGEVLGKWREVFASLQEQQAKREMKDGWRKAFDNENADEEQMLSGMMLSTRDETY